MSWRDTRIRWSFIRQTERSWTDFPAFVRNPLLTLCTFLTSRTVRKINFCCYGGPSIPLRTVTDFKSYRVILAKPGQYCKKDKQEDWWNRIENLEIDPHNEVNWFFDKNAKQLHAESIVFLNCVETTGPPY